jgi:hypothetical protein
MTEQEQINNWLVSAFNNGSQGFSEFFYYDKLNNEFFSILLIDYFMFDENFNIPDNTSVSYSLENIEILSNRMKRIAHDDMSVLSIPIADSKIQLQQQIDTFLNLNAINIDTVAIWLPEDTSIVVSLDHEESVNTDKKEYITPGRKPWWKFW